MDTQGEQPNDADDPAAALEQLFRRIPVRQDRFAPSFLAAVPLDQIRALVSDLTQRFGPVRSVNDAHGEHVIRLARADIPARIVLDPQGRIAGLMLRPAVPIVAGLDDAVRAIAALPGRTAVLVATDGRVRAAHAADAALAVGSAFKLAVLRAVDLACADGRLGWREVVALDPAWQSQGSGILQNWPDHAPVTVATLAHLMISVSDNTAADALIHLVGRAAVEALAPRNRPFPTTREAFTLKADAALRARWAAAGEAERRAVLATIAGLPLPRPDQLPPSVTTDIEWNFTASELAALLEASGTLHSLGINPGPVEPGPWRSVAYKGGSEAGVMNLSARLVGASGQCHCVIATWNDTAPLEEQTLIEGFRAVVRTLIDAPAAPPGDTAPTHPDSNGGVTGDHGSADPP